MIVFRIAALGALLFSMGACSRMLSVPTAYSALPPVSVTSVATSAVPSAAPFTVTAAASQVDPADPEESLPTMLLLGDSVRPVKDRRAWGVDPVAELAVSVRARASWQALRPMDLLLPAVLASRAVGRSTTFGATNQTGALGSSESASTRAAAQTYDREAAMNRLMKGGQATAKMICNGC